MTFFPLFVLKICFTSCAHPVVECAYNLSLLVLNILFCLAVFDDFLHVFDIKADL